MKFENYSPAAPGRALPAAKTLMKTFLVFMGIGASFTSGAQAITEIITDFNGYWKSANASNAVKPNNSHNLLAFSYNGTRYSTGVNDAVLVANGQSFVQADFWSMPVMAITGAINGNTKVGFGALYDGVYNGPSNPAPEHGIASYLIDGVKGLNIGTCIANLPVGNLTFAIQGMQPSAIGDGIPDIIVTQIADPSGSSFDRYEFRDASGVRVGNYKDIVFTNIPVVGTWTADFYSANTNPLTLAGGFTQTDRPYRLWAADLSEFGITPENYNQIRGFNIGLCGNSDVAFVAYNNKSLAFQQPLPVRFHYFTGNMQGDVVNLNWQTSAEQDADVFIVERSGDGVDYKTIGQVKAKNLQSTNNYSFTDADPLKGGNIYRLKQLDAGGTFRYSNLVRISHEVTTTGLQVFPNPARSQITVRHDAFLQPAVIRIFNANGLLVKEQAVAKQVSQSAVRLENLPKGNYLLVLAQGAKKSSSMLTVY